MATVVDNRHPDRVVSLDRLAALATATAAAELDLAAEATPEISVVLVNDATIAELNETWLDHTGPTDVLSFPQHELALGQPSGLGPFDVLGDVVVSLDTAARQADELQAVAPDWTFDHEVALLVVHGVLHLCGHDDLEPAARRVMQARETAALEGCGYGPVPRPESNEE